MIVKAEMMDANAGGMSLVPARVEEFVEEWSPEDDKPLYLAPKCSSRAT